MIASGEKKEEYRDIKHYWCTRLANVHIGAMGGDFMDSHNVIAYTFKKFDTVTFTNGYAKGSPKVIVECKGITTGLGMLSWGAEVATEYFIIKLGEIIINQK